MNYVRVYPISNKFRTELKTPDSLLISTQIIRDIKQKLGVSITECEIVILLASYRDPMNFSRIHKELPHVSISTLKRLISRLVHENIISKIIDGDILEVTYTDSLSTTVILKDIA